jgi:hypothetical protein
MTDSEYLSKLQDRIARALYFLELALPIESPRCQRCYPKMLMAMRALGWQDPDMALPADWFDKPVDLRVLPVDGFENPNVEPDEKDRRLAELNFEGVGTQAFMDKIASMDARVVRSGVVTTGN